MQKSNLFMTVFFIYFIWFRTSAGLPAANDPVPSLFVFGDSLVDVGNNNYLSLSTDKANHPHYGVDFPTTKPTGRFSNGKVAADLLAEKLELPSPPPYLSLNRTRNNSAILTGVNFASGSATIFDAFGQTLAQYIPMSQQVQDYVSLHEELVNQLQSSVAQSRLSKSIFMIAIGSNDLQTYIFSSDLRKTVSPQQYTTSLATKFKEQLKSLYDYGARKLLVVGIGQIGCIPAQRAKNSTLGYCNEEANLWCSMYNEALKTMLEQLQQELHGSLSYSYFDSFNAGHDIFADPVSYGFTDVKSACCGSGNLNADVPCNPESKYCPNRTQHFFWDFAGHPTEATSRVLVDHMFGASTAHYSYPLNVEQLVSV